MPGPEPHPRRSRPVRRAAPAAAALGLAVGSLLGVPSPAGAQQPPLLTTTTTTTEAPDEETTTTTRAPLLTTTTEADDSDDDPPLRTTTTQARSTTTTSTLDEDVVEVEEVEEVEDTVPAETTTTGRDLLVPGDGTDGAERTTTSTTAAPEVATDSGVDEETQVWLIVAGLVAVALLIGAWTARYWRRTRPAPAPDDGGTDDTTVFGRR